MGSAEGTARRYVLLGDVGAGLPVVVPAVSGSIDADTGLVLADLAANDLVNAAAFNACVAEVKAWRGWYPRQADLYNSTSKATSSP